MNEDIKLLQKEIDILKKENEKLKVDNFLLKQKEIEREKQFNALSKEKAKLTERTAQSTIAEQKLKNQVESWQKTIDELAHTIHTDIFIATDTLLDLQENEDRKKILAHLFEVRDLTDLTLWFLRKNELYKKDDKIVSIDLKQIIEKQLISIQNAPSILRLSTALHRDNLKNLIVPIKIQGNTRIEIPSEIQKVFNLLYKDLLRNAFKNTLPENPVVLINFNEEQEYIRTTISNNKLMDGQFEKWLTIDTVEEPEISKHSKAGLRILKKWLKYLNIILEIDLDKENSQTNISLLIPKKIILKEV